jgi:regulator of protease activity HflC (stomatin/prohibitin superfamily)
MELFIFLAVIVAVGSTCVFIVKEKQARPVEFFGKFSFVATAGLGFKLPWPLMVAREPIGLQLREVKDRVSVKSSDNAFIFLPISVQFKVVENKVYEAYYILDNPVAQIQSYVTNVIRTEAKSLTLEEMYGQKDVLENAIASELRAKMMSFGFEIENVLVDEPTLSPDLEKSYNDVIASERDKDAAKNRAEARRIELVGVAQAEGESLEIKARAMAKQRDIWADGCKGAFEQLREAMPGVSESEILDFLGAIDTREAIRDASANPGNVIVTSLPDSKSGQSYAEMSALIKTLTKSQQGGTNE